MTQTTTAQDSQIALLVAEAIARYSTVHADRAAAGKVAREVTEGQIRESITTSRTLGRARDHKAERKVRKDAVRALADELGVRFYVERNYDTVIVNETREVTGFSKDGNAQYSTFSEEANVVNPKGGLTVAWRIINKGKRFFVESAETVCRDDEAFDPLVGKELALTRFQNEEELSTAPYLPPVPLSIQTAYQD
jgi:hypothetical protein